MVVQIDHQHPRPAVIRDICRAHRGPVPLPALIGRAEVTGVGGRANGSIFTDLGTAMVGATLAVALGLASGLWAPAGVAETGLAVEQTAGRQWACGALRYEINADAVGRSHRRAIHRALVHFGAAAERRVRFVGYTTERRSDGTRPAAAPILVEFTWPDDAPGAFGYAEAFVDDHGTAVGGSVYLHPDLLGLPAAVTRRLTLHEFGHLAGLPHSARPDAVMHPAAGAARYSEAERAGVAAVFAAC